MHQPKKANVVVHALNRSQMKDAGDSMDGLAWEIVAAIEEKVLSLSGVSVALIVEDLQKGTIAYKEDPSQVAMYTKLHQG